MQKHVEMGRKPTKRSPKKQSFFKVLVGDFSKHLRIPPMVTKNHHILPSLGKCTLRGPSGRCWNVELENRENGLFFHNNGWQSFVKNHRLQVGYFLVFRYDGESTFKVQIYDRTCCEKDVQVAKRRTGNSTAPSAKERKKARVDHEVADMETENYNKDTEHETKRADESNRNYAMPGKGLRLDAVKKTSTGISMLFKSENACFKLTVKRQLQLYMVAVPRGLALAEGLLNKKSVEIKDPTGRLWLAKLATYQTSENSCRLDISTGWNECCKANNISVGDDTLIFEFVEQGVIRLHIIRKGPSVVLEAPNIKN